MDITTIDEPVTPSGRTFIQPQINLMINCAVGFKHHIDPKAIKTAIENSYFMKHPRFSSLLVIDNKQKKEFWRKSQVNLDNHIFIHHPKNPLIEYNNEEQEEKINAILADFAITPLSFDKPLWEIHILCELKCFIFRFHHALGDGTTIMSLFLASCEKCGGKDEGDNSVRDEKNSKINERKMGLKGIFKMIWWTTLSVMELTGRSLYVKDQKTAISGGEGVEQWPRMVATAKFSLEDMKTVKRAIPGATINDVLFGIISFGFSKYLNARSSNALRKGQKITGLAMVNLRKQPGLQEIPKMKQDEYKSAKWGNQIGFVLLPVYCHTNDPDPMNYVKRSKLMMDRKKQSLEAPLSYLIKKLTMSSFGPKVCSKLDYKILCNTTFLISSLKGPEEEFSFGGHPIAFIRPTSASLPQAVIMHMVSYAGMANMQIIVTKDIIPDPKFLAKCFEDALLEMKNAAI